MSEEKTRPRPDREKGTERGDEKTAEGSHEFAFPACCGSMIESMKKAFSPSQGHDSEPAGSCAAMMTQMMKSRCASSRGAGESTP